VQGIDYIYTLQGWLKGINSNALSPQYEMGQDGWSGTTFARVSRDVYSFGLGYFAGDYTAIGSGADAMNQAAYQHPGNTDNTGRQLFNGNISNTVVALSKIESGAAKGYSYGYDQLNRLLYMNQHTVSGSSWSNSNIISAYAESIAYDANGNILKYLRKGANGSAGPLNMDSLTYKYNLDGNGKLVNNRLNHVRDSVNNANYTVDIDNQSNNNYTYDRIGNLEKDVAEGIDTIRWTVYGKINRVRKSSGATIIDYGYDPGGNRISKKVIASGDTTKTFYVRDAQGNVLAVYEKKNSDAITWEEQHLYGSSRLGMWRNDTIAPAAPPVVIGTTPIYDSLMLGSRSYELSNHLGNVLSVISDKKIGHDSSGVVNYYIAEVLSQDDYYSGGMLMPGRKYSSSSLYRYGFNGKENDNEVKGEDNQQDYGLRVYDPRLVRFLSVDPLGAEYPWNSSYAFAEGDVIRSIDLDGAEKWFVNPFWNPFLPGFGSPIISVGKRSNNTEGIGNQIGRGVLRVARAQNNDMPYQDPKMGVPQQVQKVLETNDVASGVNDIAEGMTDLYKQVLEGSANIVPVEGALTKVIGVAIRGVKEWRRFRLATKVFKEAGMVVREAESHLKYIDLEKQVYKRTLKEGEELVQYRLPTSKGAGDYYAPKGTRPEEIGLDPSDVAEGETYLVKINKDVEEVLTSTHKRKVELYYDKSRKSKGGGIQYYSKDIKDNATFTKIEPPK
jgi:RHS repeat-associated protein